MVDVVVIAAFPIDMIVCCPVVVYICEKSITNYLYERTYTYRIVEHILSKVNKIIMR